MKRFLTLFIFTFFFFITGPLLADEAEDEAWAKERLAELKEEGYSWRQIMKIMKKEKAKRDKQNRKKKRSNEDEDEDEGSRKRSTDNIPDIDSEDTEGMTDSEKLDVIEEWWRKYLEDKNLDDDDIKVILKEEMKAQKKLVKMDKRSRERKNDSIHEDVALKRLKYFKIEATKGQLEAVAKEYKEWFYLSVSKGKKKAKSILSELKERDARARKRKGKEARSEAHSELSFQLGTMVPRQKKNIMRTFANLWEHMLKTEPENYSKEKSKVKKLLKQGGFQPKHTKVFFKHMDTVFEDDE